MRKNLTALLQKGDIKPKERVLFLVHDLVSRMKTGKDILTEADRHALSEGWTPKDNNEVREYNRLNEGWRRAILAQEAEAQMIFLNAQTDHFRKVFIDLQLSFYPFYREAKQALERLEKIKVVDSKEAIEIFNKQRKQRLKDGQDFDYAVYLLAFESLSKDLQQDLIALYEEVEYEHQYLDQEEIIADLFDGKDELTKEAKEKLAELIADASYNEFAKEYQFHYFAGIPTLELARRWAKEKGLKPTKKYGEKVEGFIKETAKDMKEGEDKTRESLFLEMEIEKVLETYARDNKTTVKAILKEACLKWLDEGLLIDEYTPLFNSDSKNTINDADTKLPHKEVFKEWIKSKTKAEQTLKELINKGELKAFEIRPQEGIVEKIDINSEPEGIRVITGESLYNFKGDYKFVGDFKKRVDEYEPNLGIVYADDDPEQERDHLDQEFLIASKTDKGEPAIFSMFGMTMKKLTAIFNSSPFSLIGEDKGELIFNKDAKQFYKDRKDELVKNYARLLAFDEVFKRLSKTYEIDLTFKIKEWLKFLEDYIDQHNDALRRATGGYNDPELDDNPFFRKYKLTLKENLFVDKEKIRPDGEVLESQTKTFKDILGDDF